MDTCSQRASNGSLSPCSRGLAYGIILAHYKSATAHPFSPKLRTVNEKENYVRPDSSQTIRQPGFECWVEAVGQV